MSEKKPPSYASWTHGKLPLTEIAEMKRRGQRIVMVTAYDAPGGRLADAAGIDIILVGDSAAMVVLGHDSTVPATVDELLSAATRRMDGSVEHTRTEFNTVRTGRASAALLDRISIRGCFASPVSSSVRATAGEGSMKTSRPLSGVERRYDVSA